jgi:hypothetical protein
MVTFKVVATGNNLKYQWQYRTKYDSTWANCGTAGNQSPEFTVELTSGRNNVGISYQCVITDASGATLTTDEVTMKVSQIIIDEVVYKKVSDTRAIVIGYNGSSANVVVQEIVEGATVAEIGESAFEGNTTLVSIDLPDTIEIIGKRAFANCINLSSMY